jgi:hypothetical protein
MPISGGDLATVTVAALDNYMRNRPVDQIGTERPLIKKLMAGRKGLMPARQYSVETVREGYGSNFAWTFGETARTFNKRSINAQAQFPWRVATDGLYLDWDMLFSAGIKVDPDPSSKGKLQMTPNEQVILFNIMSEHMEALELGFIEQLDLHLHRDGTSSTDAVVGLDALISRTPTTGTVGGLNAATKTYWRNYFAGSLASGQTLIDAMEAAWRSCVRNGGVPDFILAGSTFVDTYRKSITITQEADIGSVKTIDAGTGTGADTGLKFKGVPIVWDPTFSVLDGIEAPASANLWEKRCYFLNTKALKYEDDDMAVYNPPSPYNVRATYASLDLRCALKTNRRNAHAVLVVA